jgi:hypothetical protein
MKLTYESMLEQVEIVYTYSPGQTATYDDPEEGAEVDIEEVWLMDGNGVRVFDINPHITGAHFDALFGKYIYENLIRHAEDFIADQKAEAAEYRRESREE